VSGAVEERVLMRSKRRVSVGLAAAAIGLQLGACVSRTLPLPPPDVEALSAVDDQGMVRVRGTAHQGASIGVLNDMTQQGVITVPSDVDCNSACPFEAKVAARPGDWIRVWQFYDTPSSRDQRVPK
jgi:hypothetical protein